MQLKNTKIPNKDKLAYFGISWPISLRAKAKMKLSGKYTMKL